MKNYKLIKEYPGSPKLNTIKSENTVVTGLTFITELSNKNYTIYNISNYPEYWKEVITKDEETINHPLFRTEDNVDIYPNDTYYEVITLNFSNKSYFLNIIPLIAKSNINYDIEGNRKKGKFWFSTKEASQEYMLNDKYVLSINEIVKLLNISENQEKELKNFVKSKLQYQ